MFDLRSRRISPRQIPRTRTSSRARTIGERLRLEEAREARFDAVGRDTQSAVVPELNPSTGIDQSIFERQRALHPRNRSGIVIVLVLELELGPFSDEGTNAFSSIESTVFADRGALLGRRLSRIENDNDDESESDWGRLVTLSRGPSRISCEAPLDHSRSDNRSRPRSRFLFSSENLRNAISTS